MAKIIDGKLIAANIKDEIKSKVSYLKSSKGITPKLSVVLIGGDPASAVYVRNKERGCVEVGIQTGTVRLPSNTSENEVISVLDKLNADKSIHGILVQLPLPKHLNEKKIASRISVEKDVDGMHMENIGRLFGGEEPSFYPCTPNGIIELILSTGSEIKGKEAIVVGRSNIVGKPVAAMLLSRHATVTICHSRTTNLSEVVSRGDIVVAAVGKPKLITGAMLKPGCIVIDVGINRTEAGLAGDVDFQSASQKAAYITPVPGGVGPMTIAMLLRNTLISAARSVGYHLG